MCAQRDDVRAVSELVDRQPLSRMAGMDLNADLGESFGHWTQGDDDGLVKHITSANLACGFHAGDFRVMEATVALCRRRESRRPGWRW